MSYVQEQVKLFHLWFDPDSVADSPKMPDAKGAVLRMRLMREELAEVEAELERFYSEKQGEDKTLTNVAMELADLVYVVYGTAVTLGIELDPVVTLIHEANMRKRWTLQDVYLAPLSLAEEALAQRPQYNPDSWVVYRKDGKVLKPPSWEPADREAVRNAMVD